MLSAYAEPARGYHDREHLHEVLERIDEIVGSQGRPIDLAVVRLAAFFHDAVYETEGDLTVSNEEASARWALAALTGADRLLDQARAERVAALVRATAGHRAPEGDLEAAVLLDADLGILAASPSRYARYVAGVRHEYADVPERRFRAARVAVLRDLLDRERLFGTDHAYRTWEPAARVNLRREIDELSRPS